MKQLVLETSTAALSAALLEDDCVRAEQCLLQTTKPSQQVVGVVDTLLTALGWSVADLDLLACAGGPGSFTGLKVGMAFLKGLSTAHQTPLITVSPLLVLAYPLRFSERVIVPVIKSGRRGFVYAAGYHYHQEKRETLFEPEIFEEADLVAQLQVPALLCGNGAADLFSDRERDPAAFLLAGEAFHWPGAGNLGRLAFPLWQAGSAVDAGQVVPDYLMAPAVQGKRKQKKLPGS